jgi:hypothetical protein
MNDPIRQHLRKTVAPVEGFAIDTGHIFRFRARHKLDGHSESAAHPHWHSYKVTFWFDSAHDHDLLRGWSEKALKEFHGAELDAIVPDSSDEGLAAYFLALCGELCCTEVWLENDADRITRARHRR